VKVLQVVDFVVVMMPTDPHDGRVATESIVDAMMLVVRDHDSVVDLEEDVLLSKMFMYFRIQHV